MSSVDGYIGKKGYSIPKKNLSIEQQTKIRSDLNVKPFAPPNSIQQPKSFSIYRESPKKLYVPRFYGFKEFGIPERNDLSEGEDIDITFNGSLRPYQEKIIDAYMKETSTTGCGLLEVPCGRGKCLGYDTPVLMADKTVKSVQDIKDGEFVMGDNWTARCVMGVHSGNDQMYTIYQTQGINYSVNSAHILTLYDTYTNKVIDIPLLRLVKGNETKIDRYKGIKKLECGDYEFSTITIRKGEKDTYYGFMVGGNHRYLLGDTTVTHNTVMALNIISKLQKKTLVIVHKEFLMNQWIERIEQFLPDARVGRIQGPIVDIEDKDIVIGMLQSLSMKDYSSNAFDSFGLTISDECFPKNTKIMTDKGFINIEDLKHYVGKLKVTSYNHNTECYENKRMTNWFERPAKKCIELYYRNIYGIDNDHPGIIQNSIVCSEDHRIFSVTDKKYVFAKDLRIGNCVLGMNNIMYTIVMKNDVGMKGPLYDIEVEDNHNFFACGMNTPPREPILVHNCHHISAEVFCRSLFKIVTPYMLGLSATMKRKDGLTKVFKMFLGDVLYREERDTDDDVNVRQIEYKSSDPEFGETVYNFKGQTHYAIMIRKLCEFNHRSEFILRVLQDMLVEMPEQQIMILAHNKSLLHYLYDAIEHRNIATVGYYIGGMKEAALKETESKQVVIATYAMAEEALDIKSLASLIMATPKTDVTQAVGRILRMKHKKPIVVDIVDQHDIFKKQWIKRRRFYMKCKYKITTITSSEYNTDFDNWELLFEPGQKAKRCRKKIEQKDKGAFEQGKCFIQINTELLKGLK